MTSLKEKEELICLDVQMYYFYCTHAVGPCCRRSELDKCWLNSPFLKISCHRTEQIGGTESVVFLEVVYVEVSEPCWLLLLLPWKRDWQEEPSKFSKVSLGLKVLLWSWLALVSLVTLQMQCLTNVT